MAQIAIIMGSVYGSAQQLADAIESELEQLGHHVIFNNSPLVTDIHDVDACLVITSTTGNGELPGNIQPFYFSAQESMPLQHGKPFGIICLGDSSYDKFCGAGEKMQELFFELQGHSPVPMLKVDAGETLEPENQVMPWLKSWLAAI